MKQFPWSYILLMTVLLCVSHAGSADAAWYNAAWAYRQQVTVSSSVTASTLTNFPLHIAVTDGANELFDYAQADGDDILFTASDG